MFDYLFFCNALGYRSCSSDELDPEVSNVRGRILSGFKIALSGPFGVDVEVPAFYFDVESKFMFL